MTVEPLTNVHKQRLIAGVVRDVVSGQHMARKYNHTLDRRLQRECLRLRALDNVSAFLSGGCSVSYLYL
jgi:GDP/GTP exchange factor required for growth at low temperature